MGLDAEASQFIDVILHNVMMILTPRHAVPGCKLYCFWQPQLFVKVAASLDEPFVPNLEPQPDGLQRGA